MAMMREPAAVSVGVIGAGLAGATCARALSAAGIRCTVYEQGRGAGGRLATRTSRDMPSVRINHGAPAFTANGAEFRAMLSLLEAEGAVEQWAGCKLGVFDGRRGGGLATVEPSAELRLWRGWPTMAALGEHLLREAAPRCDARFGCQIEQISYSPEHRRWQLTPRGGAGAEGAAEHDFLVVTSALPASSERWRALFGCDAPLAEAAAAVPGLLPAVGAVGAAGASHRPVLTVLASWEGAEASQRVAEWLPCDLMNIEHHPVLQKVVRQSAAGGDSVGVAVHSTHEFATANPKAYGKRSSVAGMLQPEVAAAAAATEDSVQQQLWTALTELLPPSAIDGTAAAEPSFGPVLHRWGAAFSAPERGVAPAERWDAERCLAFAGDFVEPATPQRCHVEVAATSGLEAARHVAAAARAAGYGADETGDAWARVVLEGPGGARV
jgi:predicted NAD/FAD-dependent oxidoreductase